MPVLLLVLLLLSAPKSARLDTGQKAFVQGDFDGALKALDLAALESLDDGTLEKVQLLRAQCHAAKGDFSRAEEAFALALDANPNSTLDATRVDPVVVKLLDALRGRLTGVLSIASQPRGATVSVDGSERGTAPVELSLPIGPRAVTVSWSGGSSTSAEVLVRPRRGQTLQAVRSEPLPVPGVPAPVERSRRVIDPFAEVRGVSEHGSVDGGLEIGLGLGLPFARTGVHVRLAPNFGLAPRVAFVVPVWREWVSAFVELELPLAFRRDGVAVGLGGSGGAEWTPVSWLGLFAQLGGRHFFSNPNSLVNDRFTFQGGVRLRLP